MKKRQINHLLLLCFIYLKGCSADDDAIVTQPARAHLGQSASLYCKFNGTAKVIMYTWTRCNDSSNVVVYHLEKGPHVTELYKERISIPVYHTLTFNRVQESDFGEYCCIVTTFPDGSLKGRLHLLKEDMKRGLPMMMIVYIACGAVGFVILIGIIMGLVCRKKRRKIHNPIHYTVTKASLTPHQSSVLRKDSHTPSQTSSVGNAPREVDGDDDEDDHDMYLNVKDLTP